MIHRNEPDPNGGLARQALKRPLTGREQQLAAGLERIFKSGVLDFDQVAALLQQNGVELPSGGAGPWSAALLEQELRAINQSLDRAYQGDDR